MALTPGAEAALSAAVQTGRDGDALYFWVYNDISNVGGDVKQNDFWATCDHLNNGNCRCINHSSILIFQSSGTIHCSFDSPEFLLLQKEGYD